MEHLYRSRCERSRSQYQFLILRSAERTSRRMKAGLSASRFETRASGALLRVRVDQHNNLEVPDRAAARLVRNDL